MSEVKKPRTWKMWCGFMDDRPYVTGRTPDDPYGTYGCGLFTSERLARKAFTDVRRVTVTETPRRARGRKP